MERTIYDLLWICLVYAFSGWCLEVCIAAVRRHKLINRGFLNAPFCMLYGVAAVSFELFLPELKDRLFFLFLGGTLLASFLEYWTGRGLERLFHKKWWDYSNEKFHLDGYVCLKYSLLWGVFAVITIKFTNPLLIKMINWVPNLIGVITLWVIYGVIAADALSTIAAVLQMHHRLKRIDRISEDMQKLSDSLGNALTRRIQHRMAHAYPNMKPEQLLAAIKHHQKETAQLTGKFGEGCSFYKLVSLFFIGAFLGDIVETIFVYVTTHVLMSRSSVAYGPFSIVWGLGCVMLTVVLYRYRNSNDRHIFFTGTILGGAYEYACSVFTERVFGTVFWDYSHLPFNLGGRINLLYCFFWGIISVIWLKMVYPFFSKWIEEIPVKMGRICCHILIVFMVFDMAVTAIALTRYRERQNQMVPDHAIESWLDDHFPNQRIEQMYPNMKIVH